MKTKLTSLDMQPDPEIARKQRMQQIAKKNRLQQMKQQQQQEQAFQQHEIDHKPDMSQYSGSYVPNQ
jgi:hypothetical protein